jgi:hypothetical protein
MVTAQCPYCFATDEVPDEYAGRVTKCLTCGKSFTIKFVPTLYRESATPVVVTPKKAIHMGLPKSGKPRAGANGFEQPNGGPPIQSLPIGGHSIDAQSREIFAELTQTASVDSHETARERHPREASLVDDLTALDTALTLVKAAVGIWVVGLLAFCAYAAITGQYVPAVAALGLIVLLGVGLNLLRASRRAFTNIVRALLEIQRQTSRTAAEQKRTHDHG